MWIIRAGKVEAGDNGYAYHRPDFWPVTCDVGVDTLGDPKVESRRGKSAWMLACSWTWGAGVLSLGIWLEDGYMDSRRGEVGACLDTGMRWLERLFLLATKEERQEGEMGR